MEPLGFGQLNFGHPEFDGHAHQALIEALMSTERPPRQPKPEQ